MHEVHRQAWGHHVEVGTIVVEKKTLPTTPTLVEAGLLTAVSSCSAVADDDRRPDNKVRDVAFHDMPLGRALRSRILGRISRRFPVGALSDWTGYVSRAVRR